MPPYNSMPQGGAFGKPQQGGFGQPPMRQPLPMQPPMGGPNPMSPTPLAYGGMTPPMTQPFNPYGPVPPMTQPPTSTAVMPSTQPPMKPDPTNVWGSYGFDQSLAGYLNNQNKLSQMDGAPVWGYDPATKMFTGRTRGGSTQLSLAEMQQRAAGYNGGMPQKDFTPYPTRSDGIPDPFRQPPMTQPLPMTQPYVPGVKQPYSTNPYSTDPIRPWMVQQPLMPDLGPMLQGPSSLPPGWTPQTLPRELPTAQPMPQTLPPTSTAVMPSTQPPMTLPTMLPTFPQPYNGPGKQGGLSQVQQGGPRRPLPYPPRMG